MEHPVRDHLFIVAVIYDFCRRVLKKDSRLQRSLKMRTHLYLGKPYFFPNSLDM